LAPFFRKFYYRDDPVLKDAFVAFSTHTYQNRCFENQHINQSDKDNDGLGVRILKRLYIAPEYWKYFHHQIGRELWGFPLHDVIDFTSAGIRTADWAGGVSAKHVDDVLMYDYWPWESGAEWEKIRLIAVTNGDRREITAHKFIEAMREANRDDPTLDLDCPTPQQVYKTKKWVAKAALNDLIEEKIKNMDGERAKELRDLGLNKIDPKLPMVAYSGRVVKEKAGRARAFSDWSIEQMVEMGIQVVIGANAKVSDPYILDTLESLMKRLAKKSGQYKGKFILMRDIDPEDQRAIFAAMDMQIQDSDPGTEAAGYSEADAGACGALEIAPPWRAGLLQSQETLA